MKVYIRSSKSWDEKTLESYENERQHEIKGPQSERPGKQTLNTREQVETNQAHLSNAVPTAVLFGRVKLTPETRGKGKFKHVYTGASADKLAF